MTQVIRKTVSLGKFCGHSIRLDCRFPDRREYGLNNSRYIAQLKESYALVLKRSDDYHNVTFQRDYAIGERDTAKVKLARSRTLGRAWLVACLITWLALAVTVLV